MGRPRLIKDQDFLTVWNASDNLKQIMVALSLIHGKKVSYDAVKSKAKRLRKEGYELKSFSKSGSK